MMYINGGPIVSSGASLTSSRKEQTRTYLTTCTRCRLAPMAISRINTVSIGSSKERKTRRPNRGACRVTGASTMAEPQGWTEG
jgi:hypothetical protein